MSERTIERVKRSERKETRKGGQREKEEIERRKGERERETHTHIHAGKRSTHTQER